MTAGRSVHIGVSKAPLSFASTMWACPPCTSASVTAAWAPYAIRGGGGHFPVVGERPVVQGAVESCPVCHFIVHCASFEPAGAGPIFMGLYDPNRWDGPPLVIPNCTATLLRAFGCVLRHYW